MCLHHMVCFYIAIKLVDKGNVRSTTILLLENYTYR